MAISGTQIRMARAALRWSAEELATRAGLSKNTVITAEADRDTRQSTIDAMEKALGAAGIEFISENGGGPGVRLAKRKRKAKK